MTTDFSTNRVNTCGQICTPNIEEIKGGGVGGGVLKEPPRTPV